VAREAAAHEGDEEEEEEVEKDGEIFRLLLRTTTFDCTSASEHKLPDENNDKGDEELAKFLNALV